MALCIAAWLIIPLDIEPVLLEKTAGDIQDESKLQDATSKAASCIHIRQLPNNLRQSIWWSAMVYNIERAFMTSSVEAATALILEKEFAIPTVKVGWLIGGAFISALPLMLLGLFVRGRLISESRLIYIAAVTAVLCCLCFIPYQENHKVAYSIILVGDSVLFGAVFIADSICYGLASIAADEDSFYSLDNFVVGCQIGGSVFRFFAYPLARFLLINQGRGMYAGMQLIIATMGLGSCARVAWAQRGRSELVIAPPAG